MAAGEEAANFGDDYEEGGIKIVPFNLASVLLAHSFLLPVDCTGPRDLTLMHAQDRETGHFDESGNYIDNQFEGAPRPLGSGCEKAHTLATRAVRKPDPMPC